MKNSRIVLLALLGVVTVDAMSHGGAKDTSMENDVVAGSLKCLATSKEYVVDMGICGKRAASKVSMCGNLGNNGRWQTQAEMDLESDRMFGDHHKIPAALQPVDDAECRVFYGKHFCGADRVRTTAKCSDFYCQNAKYSADKYVTMCDDDSKCAALMTPEITGNPAKYYADLTERSELTALAIPSSESHIASALSTSPVCCAAIGRAMARVCDMTQEDITEKVAAMHDVSQCDNTEKCRRVFVEMTWVVGWNSHTVDHPGRVPEAVN